jgi:NitT/TauT family transport system substrate-binding protein
MRRSSILAAAAIMIPAGLRARVGRAQALPLVLNLATAPVADNVPARYAFAQGWFAQAGLDIKLSVLGGGAAIGAAVVGGAADIGATNMFTAILAHAKGIDLKILAPGGRYEEGNPTTQLLVGIESPIRTAKDLEGHSVAVAGLNDLSAVSVRVWMAANGANPDAVRFIETPMSTMPAMLVGKRIDAMIASEPALQAAESTGQTRMLAVPYAAIGKHFFTSVWVVNSSWGAAHRDAALKFADVMRRATIYTNSHFDELIPFIAEYTKIPVEALRAMRKVKSGTTLVADDIQPLIDAVAKFKGIPKVFPASEIMFPGAP